MGIKNANFQEQKILEVFSGKNRGLSFTPFEVLKLSGLRAPITSIRRAMTDMTKVGMLIKTDECRMGAYGQLNHCWVIRRNRVCKISR